MDQTKIKRDTSTGAVINTDISELERYRQIRSTKKDINSVVELKTQVALIHTDIGEIKKNINTILGILTENG